MFIRNGIVEQWGDSEKKTKRRLRTFTNGEEADMFPFLWLFHYKKVDERVQMGQERKLRFCSDHQELYWKIHNTMNLEYSKQFDILILNISNL